MFYNISRDSMHHRIHHFFGRHHGGRGFGHFGRGFMGGDMGGRAFGMGRKLASVDLQLLILGLLAEKPRHGYEIIKALDERSKGFYIPSPGMVYPALTYLEEIGHATVEVEGSRKLYHITDAGKEHLDDNRRTADAWTGSGVRCAPTKPGKAPTPSTSAEVQRNCCAPGAILNQPSPTSGIPRARNNSASSR